jgi:hypothetical protein
VSEPASEMAVINDIPDTTKLLVVCINVAKHSDWIALKCENGKIDYQSIAGISAAVHLSTNYAVPM